MRICSHFNRPTHSLPYHNFRVRSFRGTCNSGLSLLILSVMLVLGCGDSETVEISSDSLDSEGSQSSPDFRKSGAYAARIAPTSQDLSIELAQAIKSNDLTRIDNLIQAGADPNREIEGVPPLHLAVLEGLDDVVKLLLSHKSDVNRPDSRGMTPLHYAASLNQITLAEILILNGADVNAKDNSGRTVLDIAGYAEGSELEVGVVAGMVVSIDPNNEGELVISTEAYDSKVAGVISGASGVKTGMKMGQAGTIAYGDYPVTMTGRTYCWADAFLAPIHPGDLLTTSQTPGHVMKVLDQQRGQGATIGKAMTGISEGRGLILVLVNLQ